MCRTVHFNPRSPVRGATAPCPPVGDSRFQSTPPCAGGDDMVGVMQALYDISIHAPLCGGRRRRAIERCRHSAISIHAPLCGGRHIHLIQDGAETDISIHAPLCGGRPQFNIFLQSSGLDFKPRPPVRGATMRQFYRLLTIRISIHAPLCGGRQSVRSNTDLPPTISIHAPLCGGRRFPPSHTMR